MGHDGRSIKLNNAMGPSYQTRCVFERSMGSLQSLFKSMRSCGCGIRGKATINSARDQGYVRPHYRMRLRNGHRH
jgi:hypothetical protein